MDSGNRYENTIDSFGIPSYEKICQSYILVVGAGGN